MKNSRKYTLKLIEAAEDGYISWEVVARTCLGFMSEADVAEMCHANDILFNAEDETDEDSEDLAE